MLSEEIKENATAIIMGILDNHGVRHCDRINNRVCLIFCEYAGIHFNIKIRVNGQVEAWTYTEKPVPVESRIFVLELLNTFHSANHEIQAYINEDNLIIFKKAFSCIESGSVSEHAISSNLEAFFGQTIRPHVEFCVSEFRQTQEYHVINVHDGGLFPLSTALPVG